ncbi:hypothetical protein JCM33374_g923 [Metschnikowia sp. JCM 33374]|nr:hypothetical protein JCM33374_g923 [Metschnikowia sp. JCM 33374]
MSTRLASHSGSWYSDDGTTLEQQVSKLLVRAPAQKNGARVILGPHAGYTYCGERLAEAYGVWDCKATSRVFILGPSHHVYFKDTALLSGHAFYDTPIGKVPVDTEVCKKLAGSMSELFDYMSESVDEDEHSFEMHLPFLVGRCRAENVDVPPIIPVMISGLSLRARRAVVDALAPYFADKTTTFVVSSDFCHWGRRFSYTAYVPDSQLVSLTQYKSSLDRKVPIYRSIEYLDRTAMLTASTGSVAKWDAYIETTGNTICGQKPIAIVLSLLEKYSATQDVSSTGGETFQWLGYSQSSKAVSANDSSVSYAAGYVSLK